MMAIVWRKNNSEYSRTVPVWNVPKQRGLLASFLPGHEQRTSNGASVTSPSEATLSSVHHKPARKEVVPILSGILVVVMQ